MQTTEVRPIGCALCSFIMWETQRAAAALRLCEYPLKLQISAEKRKCKLYFIIEKSTLEAIGDYDLGETSELTDVGYGVYDFH